MNSFAPNQNAVVDMGLGSALAGERALLCETISKWIDELKILANRKHLTIHDQVSALREINWGMRAENPNADPFHSLAGACDTLGLCLQAIRHEMGWHMIYLDMRLKNEQAADSSEGRHY